MTTTASAAWCYVGNGTVRYNAWRAHCQRGSIPCIAVWRKGANLAVVKVDMSPAWWCLTQEAVDEIRALWRWCTGPEAPYDHGEPSKRPVVRASIGNEFVRIEIPRELLDAVLVELRRITGPPGNDGSTSQADDRSTAQAHDRSTAQKSAGGRQ